MGTRFSGKSAIVTGGASGIGRATAERLAREGAAVLVADLNAEGGQTVAAGIVDAGGTARSIRLDVTSEADCRKVVAAAVEAFGGVDLVVNSAGIGEGAPVAGTDEALWDRVIDVNLKGVYLMSKASFPALVERGGGSIVNLASLAALVVAPGLGAYAASKGGVVQLTRVLALEGAPSRIRANALCPVWVDTPMLHRAVASARDPEAALKSMADRIPLGRIATVDDVAAAALFLASDEASFITGIALPIDGGTLCQ